MTNFWDGLHRLTGMGYPDGSTTNLYYLLSGTPYANSSGGLKILDLTATRDKLGFWTSYVYDPLRRKIAVTNANAVVTGYGYCTCGAVSYVTNAWNTGLENTTVFTYDDQGNRTVENYPDGYNVTNWFDALQQKTVTGDGTGYRWLFYDNLGRLTVISNAYGDERIVSYDLLNRPVYVADANGVTVTNTYDLLNRAITRGYPDHGVEHFTYSARGLVTYTNQLGFGTEYGYDAAGRKTAETNADSQTIYYTNSVAGDLLALRDGKGQVTKWTYDPYGRVTNKVDQAGSVVLRYTYDPDNRLTNRWSAAKGNTGYTFDSVGNLTYIKYPVSSSVTLDYDLLNRLTNMVDGAGTTKYSYTAAGQLLTEDGPFASDTVSNTYRNRKRVALALQQPTGIWTNGFDWDLAGRLEDVVSPAGSFGYTYTPVGSGYSGRLVRKLTLPNSSYITNAFDSVGRMLSTALKNSGNTVLDSYAYLYDLAGERTNLTRADASTVAYLNDRIGQLTVATDSAGSGTYSRGYTYDAAWNLNWRTNGTSGTYDFTSDSRNQLSNYVSSSSGSESFTYDANGNLTERDSLGYAVFIYTYDDENRLTSMEYDDYGTPYYQLSGLVYDGLGRLREASEYTYDGSQWNLTDTKWYIYDGWRVIQERDGNNTPVVSYTRGRDLSGSLDGAGGIGGLLARSCGYSAGSWATNDFYFADGNGNITYMLNSSQAMVASYRYDPYGNELSVSGSLAGDNSYRFSSKELVAKPLEYYGALYYYDYRFYDPFLQRWLNRDPIGESGGVNLYAFVRNQPTTDTDALGLLSTLCNLARAAQRVAWVNFSNGIGTFQEYLAAQAAADAICSSDGPGTPRPPKSPMGDHKYRTPPFPEPPPLNSWKCIRGGPPVRITGPFQFPPLEPEDKITIGVGIIGIGIIAGPVIAPVLAPTAPSAPILILAPAL